MVFVCEDHICEVEITIFDVVTNQLQAMPDYIPELTTLIIVEPDLEYWVTWQQVCLERFGRSHPVHFAEIWLL